MTSIAAPSKDPSSEVPGIVAACQVVGGQAALARLLGVDATLVNQWFSGRRPISARNAVEIERRTGIKCERLCPTVDWAFLRKSGKSDRKAA